MIKRIIPIILVLALVLTGCGAGKSVDLKSEGFTRIQSFKDGDEKITMYVANVSAEKTKQVFTDWAKGNGWKETDGLDELFGVSSLGFEKGKDAMLINIIDAGGSVSVNVMEIKDGAVQAESNKKPTPTPKKNVEKYIGYDSIFDLSDDYKEIECQIYGDVIIKYTFNGQKTINGVKTEHITLVPAK